MAEGFARALRGAAIDAYSAGTHPHGLNPLAIRAMAEVGIDISTHASRRPEEIGVSFDLVITVCDSAHDACPVFPSAHVMHVGFDDPPRLAKGARDDEEAMPHYRRVRDEIRAFIESFDVNASDPREQSLKACECGPGCCGAPTEDRAEDRAVALPLEIAGGSATRPAGSFAGSSASAARASQQAEQDALRNQVREGYARIAATGSWSALSVSKDASDEPSSTASSQSSCCAGGGCCGPATFTPEQLAQAIGYSTSELASVPEGSNMGLSCGNPTAIAGLRADEVVVDLGAGGGFDCFIAGAKVGARGRVIGIDMTPAMISKARTNVAGYVAQTGFSNVEFRLGEIEHLPVADASVDVVISNCVLNLSPDKAQVWREIMRILKPGGRVAVSDLALLQPLPDAVRADLEALVGCVAGAMLVDEMRALAHHAGLRQLRLEAKSDYIDAMTDWQDPLYLKIVAALPAGARVSDFVTSLNVTAVKP
jgi:SAM-dependent methyltransferase/protein-tyrosine-phosphatase